MTRFMVFVVYTWPRTQGLMQQFADSAEAAEDDEENFERLFEQHLRRLRAQLLREPPKPFEHLLGRRHLRRAWWKVETPQLWCGPRRAPGATASVRAAQAALWDP